VNKPVLTAVLSLIVLCLSNTESIAKIIPVPAGENQIQIAVAKAVAGDTLMLTESSLYLESDLITQPLFPLTIMADPQLDEHPIWNTDGIRIIRARHDLTLEGIKLDGGGEAVHAVSNNAPQPNTIIIKNCIITGVTRNGITSSTRAIKTLRIQNTIFHHIGDSGISFRINDVCRNLEVSNSTFYNIGYHAIVIAQETTTLRVRLKNITAHNIPRAIYLKNLIDAEVTHSIITGSKVYAIRTHPIAILHHIYTFANRQDFRDATGDVGCIQADPLYYDAKSGDFSLLPESPCFQEAALVGPIGDPRWIGLATKTASRLRVVNLAFDYGTKILAGVSGVALILLYMRQRAVTALRVSKEEEEAATRAKTTFLANMSHEIRTPMNAIIGMTDLALDTKLSDEQRDYIETVKVSGDALLNLINDILDFSKIEAGKLEFESTDIDLRDFLDKTTKILNERAQTKGLTLKTNVAPDVPEYLLGDPHRLRQILINLIGNAIKFTENGEIVLSVKTQAHDHDTVVLNFSVHDTGIQSIRN